MPKWIEPRFSLGSIATIVGMLVVLWNSAISYGQMEAQLAAVQSKQTGYETYQASAIQASAALLAEINRDRLEVAKHLAELRTDVSYLRRWVEEMRRAERTQPTIYAE